MIKSLVPLIITSFGFAFVGILFNNCAGYQDNSLPGNNLESTSSSDNTPYLNPPDNDIYTTLSSFHSGKHPTQLQINGDCFLGSDTTEHKIEIWLYKNENSEKIQKTDTVSSKCEHGRYFAVLDVGSSDLDTGSYGIKGNLYLNGSTTSSSVLDKTFCYGSCN